VIALPRHAFPTTTAAAAAAAGSAEALRRALFDAAGRLATWAERRRERRALLRLSDAMLKDIGLGRGDAFREAAKPFWRD
jgi:uncharacterized protein YjiS (DUF1127 family)